MPVYICWLQAGAFKIGDTAGTLDNIIACKLYRPGSVGFVSKSGGMSNEMYNVLARATDGLYEGMTGIMIKYDVCRLSAVEYMS
jgi:ATP citrate (pro-S)-lyase